MTTELLNPPAKANLVMPRDEAVKALCAQIDEGARLRRLRIRSAADLDKAREMKMAWTLSTTSLLTRMFDDESQAEEFNRWVSKMLPEFASLGQFIERYADEMDQRLRKLVAILKRVESEPEVVKGTTSAHASELAERSIEAARQEADTSRCETEQTPVAEPEPTSPQASAGTAGPRPTGVLILHARNEAIEKSVTSFVNALGYELIQAAAEQESTKAVIEKLSQSPKLAFAVLLAGPEDRGDAEHHTPPRWDFELGFCMGKLGAGRVCALHIGGTGLAYDDYGMLHIPVDPAEGWQLQLARQLKRAGIPVDLNRLC